MRNTIEPEETTSYTYGDMTLYNGDYKKTITLKNHFDLIFTSPPYNIGSKCPKFIGRRRLGGYDRKSWGAIEGYPDALPEREYQKSQKAFLEWCARAIKPNGIIIYNHKLRHRDGIIIKPDEWFPSKEILVLCAEVVWDKKSTHNHCKQFPYPQSERLYVFKRPGAKTYFKNQNFYWDNTSRHGVGDVWQIPRDFDVKHNAPFPLRLARQCIRMWCPPKGIVCDPYCGSGTSMISAFLEGRGFVGTELQQKYYDLAVSRFKNYTDFSSENQVKSRPFGKVATA